MSPDFKTMSAEAAKSFLQTVVVVDDEATFTSEDNVPPATKIELDSDSAISEDEDEDHDREDPSEEIDKHNDPPHHFNAKDTVDAFAEEGLVCSIMRPEKKIEVESEEGDESLIERVSRVSRRSDLLVLDWEIDEDSGDTTTKIIERMLAEDKANRRGCLRLIAVYTGEPGLEDISRKIAEKIGFDYSDREDLALHHGPVKIVVYAKEAIVKSLGSFENQRVSFQDLPGRLIDDFAEMTEGLVSNAAVKSLSVLRDNTHSLLERLHSDLDAPYLTHRLLLTQPEDASDFLLSLIVSELQALLDGHDIGGHGSGEEIEAWILSRHDSSTEFQIGDAKFSRGEMAELLIGSSERKLSESRKQSHFRKITAKLDGNVDDDSARERDMEFAVLTSMSDQYRGAKPAPMLTSGTVLKELEVYDGFQHWLCIQPRCDSVRLNGEPRQYPLLPYEKVNSDSGKFDLIVREEDEFVRLKLIRKPYKCQIVSFAPSSEDPHTVRASKQHGSFIFASHVSNGEPQRKFRWLGELKSEQAQRDTIAFASQMSRPGLDEFEWLRLSAK